MVFNPKGWPRTRQDEEAGFFGNSGSLIGLGLYANYNLPTYRDRTTNPKNHTNIDPPGLDVFNLGNRGAQWYAYPELAKFYQADRSIKGPNWFVYGFRQVVAGNDPVSMTPFKMAEMGGKLFNFDRDFRITVSDSVVKREASPFQEDASWKGRYFDFVKDIVYGSMYNVVNVVDSTAGTAEVLGYLLKRRKRDKSAPRYFYYAKTGTIGDAEDPDAPEDKLLMLIISKNDVRKMKDPKELAENKIYVLYFTGLRMQLQSSRPRWDLFVDLITQVEESYLFKKYMSDARNRRRSGGRKRPGEMDCSFLSWCLRPWAWECISCRRVCMTRSKAWKARRISGANSLEEGRHFTWVSLDSVRMMIRKVDPDSVKCRFKLAQEKQPS